ncbi:MAG: hypothetical protein WCJ30_11875 [Deltaproteobacteria bacterium]
MSGRRATPHPALVRALSHAVSDATIAGDLATARVAMDALQGLLADSTVAPVAAAVVVPATAPVAAVVGLADRRRGER